jgi:hypothetical protein
LELGEVRFHLPVILDRLTTAISHIFLANGEEERAERESQRADRVEQENERLRAQLKTVGIEPEVT